MTERADYLTIAEVAEILRTPAETVRYWRHVGKGPASFKLGRRVLFAREEVERFLAESAAVEATVAQIPPAHVRLGRPAPKGASTEASLVCPHCGHGIEVTVRAGQR